MEGPRLLGQSKCRMSVALPPEHVGQELAVEAICTFQQVESSHPEVTSIKATAFISIRDPPELRP